jgi:hypothetical protein
MSAAFPCAQYVPMKKWRADSTADQLPPDEHEMLEDWLFDELFADGFLGDAEYKILTNK